MVASPLADGPDGSGIDAFITFRRGLINGTPATETAIQIYTTTDGGASYQPTGEITDPDFFGYDNTKVSQTGNPVVASDGTLWQSYYNGTIAKVAHYDPVTGDFDVFVVAERPADVGNVFPTLAIDSADNLYYAWIEGGTFDVLFSASTDAGQTCRNPCA